MGQRDERSPAEYILHQRGAPRLPFGASSPRVSADILYSTAFVKLAHTARGLPRERLRAGASAATDREQ
jgi:hypothetical protein